MSFFIWLGLVLAVAVPLWFLTRWGVRRWNVYTRSHGFAFRTILGTSALLWIPWTALSVATFLSPLIYEYPDWGHKLYAVENGRVIEQPWWGTVQVGKKLVWMPSANTLVAQFNSSVSPITSNPKVRRISYDLAIYIADDRTYLSKSDRLGAAHETVVHGLNYEHLAKATRKLVGYWTYEFNDAYSAQLAEFYNPLDDIQQAKFLALADAFFGPRLASDGLRVTVGRFGVQ